MLDSFRTRIKNVLNIDDPKLTLSQTDLFVSPLASASYSASQQLQEIFCDIFAICVFGTSYLNAFRYLLEPNSGPRSPVYPKNSVRIKIQSDAARALGLMVPEGYEASFNDSTDNHDDTQTLLLEIADETVQRHWKDICDFANTIARAANVHCEVWINSERNESKFFERRRPALGSKSLPTIIDAAWGRYSSLVNDRSLSADDLNKQILHLFEITLKTLEVFELEQTINGAKL